MSESHGGSEATAREATFEDLLLPESSPDSDPQDTPGDDAAAAGQPTGEDAETRHTALEGTDEDRSPFIPRSRFDEVNTKLGDLKKWRDEHEWAGQIDRNALQTMVEWYGKANMDTRGFAINLLDELLQSPEHSQAVRSELARRLGTRPAQAAPDDGGPQADIEILDHEGKAVGRTYSDKALAKFAEQIRQQALAEVDTKYADKFSVLDQLRQRETHSENERAAQSFATSFVQELSQLPMFADHKTEIGEYLKAHPPANDSHEAVTANAFRAYYAVVGPKLSGGAQNQQTVLADLQRKARANTGVNPGSASSASPKAPSSFYDATLQW